MAQQQQAKYLTLIGCSGAGKSTTGNLLLGAHHFESTEGNEALMTEVSKGVPLPGTDFVVVASPCIGQTSNRTPAFFEKITDHLNEHGGVVAFVHSQEKLSERMRFDLEALSSAVGVPFSSFCVLVTTKPSDDPFKSDASNAHALEQYQHELEKQVAEYLECGPFATKYAFHTRHKETCADLMYRLKRDLPEIRGIQPGMVLTWNTIVSLTDGSTMDLKQQEELLQARVQRAVNVVDAVERDIAWHEKRASICATPTDSTIWIPFVGWTASPGTAVAAEASRDQLKLLQPSLEDAKQRLQQAKDDLAMLNIAALQAEAKQICDLLA